VVTICLSTNKNTGTPAPKNFEKTNDRGVGTKRKIGTTVLTRAQKENGGNVSNKLRRQELDMHQTGNAKREINLMLRAKMNMAMEGTGGRKKQPRQGPNAKKLRGEMQKAETSHKATL